VPCNWDYTHIRLLHRLSHALSATIRDSVQTHRLPSRGVHTQWWSSGVDVGVGVDDPPELLPPPELPPLPPLPPEPP
jgi:hypothetical protein